MIFGWAEMVFWSLIAPGGFMGLISSIKYDIVGGEGPNPYTWSTYNAMNENG
jgi:hypothetical protein